MAIHNTRHRLLVGNRIIEVEHQADKHGHVLRLLIRVSAVLPELIDLGGKLVDPLVALAQ